MIELALPQWHHHMSLLPAAAPPSPLPREYNCFCASVRYSRSSCNACLFQFSPKTSNSNRATNFKLHTAASRQRYRELERPVEDKEVNDFYIGDRATSRISYGEEEEEEDDSGMLLSLTEKPDRNFALLDEYELEELDCSSDNPNHKSGEFFTFCIHNLHCWNTLDNG